MSSNDPMVTVPVEEFTKLSITGEQYVALIQSEEMRAAFDTLKAALPRPIAFLLTPILAETKMRIIDAMVTYDEADVEAAIRKHCPKVAEHFDAGLSPLESALRLTSDEESAA